MTYAAKISAADLAAVLGISERRVNQLAAKKILTRENGLFDLAENVQAFVGFRERAVAAEFGETSFRAARTDLYREKAAMAKLDRAEREGKVLDVAEVRRAWITVATVVRNRLLGVAAKLAPRLVGVRSAAEAQAVVYARFMRLILR
jgi:phage terminase Nu1 subunit (DNA packaging protein)